MNIENVKGGVYMIDAPFRGFTGVLGTYVVRGEHTMVVDPGPPVSAPYIIKGVEKLGIKKKFLKYIAATHIHLDHFGGSWKLLDSFPSANIIVHPRGSDHIIRPTKLEVAARKLFGNAIDNYGEIKGVAEDRVINSKDNERLDLGNVEVQTLWTPGHASHHQCFYVIEDKTLIVGDAGGFYNPQTGIIMPTTPPPFNPKMAVKSIEKLIDLNPEHICYGHFGFTDNAKEKLETHKRQINLWSRIVEEGIEKESSLEDIYSKIKSEDPMALHTRKYSSEMRERTTSINLLGFVKYYEWIKEKRDNASTH